MEMVQSISKAHFKNLKGSDIALTTQREGRCLIITIEQNYWSCCFSCCKHLLHVLLGIIVFTSFFPCSTRLLQLLVCGCCVFTIFNIHTFIYKESLIVVHSLGYQVICNYIIGKHELFIPWDSVQNTCINEVIVKHKVLYTLNILTKENKEQKQIIPVFFASEIRLSQLESLYQEISALQVIR